MNQVANNPFKKAERRQAKIKIALTGTSGSGKTYSALKIAQGLGKKIALIDTENGSASLYSDSKGMPEFDTVSLSAPFTTLRYLELIRIAEKAGYDVIIIDSISHQWSGEGGIIDRKDKEAAAKPGQNSYTLWAKYTPEHEALKTAIVQSGCHIIATMRSKTDYVMETNDKGKQAPRKVGLAPVQREQMEYEFSLVLDLSDKHYASVSKDRTELFGEDVFIPSIETGEKIAAWLASGKEPLKEAPPQTQTASALASGPKVHIQPTPTQAKRPETFSRGPSGEVTDEDVKKYYTPASQAGKWKAAQIKEHMAEYYKADKLSQLTRAEFSELCAIISEPFNDRLANLVQSPQQNGADLPDWEPPHSVPPGESDSKGEKK